MDVKSIWNADLQRRADWCAGRCVGLDERQQLCFDTPELRDSNLRCDEQQDDCRDQRTHDYPTGLRGMNAATFSI